VKDQGQHVKVWHVNLKDGRAFRVATIEQGKRKPVDCKGCSAPCCKGILKPILTEKEFLSRRFRFTYSDIEPGLRDAFPKDVEVSYLVTLDVDPQKGCIYLDHDRCSIWPYPPKSCLAYDCREDERMKDFVGARRKRRI